uniref:Guanylate kinase-like domain-containing protein n=1 Tax=Globodera pallida TaxID=36090 RepID=A0A183C7C3_GLOPA
MPMLNDDNGICAKESPPVCSTDSAGGGGSSGEENGGENSKSRPNLGLELSGEGTQRSKDGSPPSTSKLSFNNVVGYARSRLFPNSDQLAVVGKDTKPPTVGPRKANAASVERLQLAQYAPIVILIDVESRSRVRELRSKAGANTNSSRKLLEQSQRIKKQHQHMLTATLDASKEDQWFDALRQLIFHLQERRVWMPEFSPECPLDDLLLFPIQQPGETPTSDSAGDYGAFDAGPSNGGQSVPPANASGNNNHFLLMGQPKGEGGPFLVPNPMYTLNLKQQHFGGVPLPIHHQMSSSIGSESEHQHRPRQQPLYCSNSRQSEPPPPFHALPSGSARNSPFPPPEQQQHSVYNHSQHPMEAKSQLLAQLATELGSPVQQHSRINDFVNLNEMFFSLPKQYIMV